jgi:predicted RNA binding protein YcfA (HicA-like mRNA interferase family)
MSYNRRRLIAALERAGMFFVREGGGHTIVTGPNGRKTSIPRHGDVHRVTARKIAKQLGINWSDVEKGL